MVQASGEYSLMYFVVELFLAFPIGRGPVEDVSHARGAALTCPLEEQGKVAREGGKSGSLLRARVDHGYLSEDGLVDE